MTDGGALGLTARGRVSPHEAAGAPEGPPGAAAELPELARGRRERQKLWGMAKGSSGLRGGVVVMKRQLGAMEVVLGAVP